MKKASAKVGRNRGGFIRSTVAPVHDDHDTHFGWVDILMILALVGGTVAIARLLLAH